MLHIARRPLGLEYSEQRGKTGHEVGEMSSDQVVQWTLTAGVCLDIVL